MYIAIKISKEHFDRTEMKDWIFKALIDEITIHMANYANSKAFPELALGIVSTIRKFKKSCQNPIYCKIIASLIERIEENC